MGNLGKRITNTAKKELAKQIGKSVRKVIEKNVDSSDPRALQQAQKYAEQEAIRAMGGGKSAGSSKKTTSSNPMITGISGPRRKNREFKVKIGGIGKIARDAVKGVDIGDSIKKNGRFDVRYTVRF